MYRDERRSAAAGSMPRVPQPDAPARCAAARRPEARAPCTVAFRPCWATASPARKSVPATGSRERARASIAPDAAVAVRAARERIGRPVVRVGQARARPQLRHVAPEHGGQGVERRPEQGGLAPSGERGRARAAGPAGEHRRAATGARSTRPEMARSAVDEAWTGLAVRGPPPGVEADDDAERGAHVQRAERVDPAWRPRVEPAGTPTAHHPLEHRRGERDYRAGSRHLFGAAVGGHDRDADLAGPPRDAPSPPSRAGPRRARGPIGRQGAGRARRSPRGSGAASRRRRPPPIRSRPAPGCPAATGRRRGTPRDTGSRPGIRPGGRATPRARG